MEVYLDTNIIIGWFKNVKRSLKEGYEPKEPKKLEFLKSKNFGLYVSDLTKFEVFRYLKSEWSGKSGESKRLWKDFRDRYKITELTLKKVNITPLIDIALNVNLGRKTVINLIHLQFSEKNNLVFLTGDKPITDRLKNYFPKTISYLDLRKNSDTN